MVTDTPILITSFKTRVDGDTIPSTKPALGIPWVVHRVKALKEEDTTHMHMHAYDALPLRTLRSNPQLNQYQPSLLSHLCESTLSVGPCCVCLGGQPTQLSREGGNDPTPSAGKEKEGPGLVLNSS
jgi:hypothetical protein